MSQPPSTSSIPPYVEEYGLSAAPFAEITDEAEFFSEASRKQRLNLLQNLAQYSDEFLLVTGPEGSGKTTLLRRLEAKPSTGWLLCAINATSMLHSVELLQQLAQRLQIKSPSQDETELQKAVRERCLALLHRAQLVVVAVDEAHLLPLDSLSTLIRLGSIRDNAGAALLRVILFAEPGLAPTLTNNQQITPPKTLRKIDLVPFTETETADYIRHRLARAGMVVEGPFTAGAIQKIHKQSGGQPGAINHLAHRLLLERSKSPAARPVMSSGVNLRIGRYLVLGGSAVLIILALIFQGDINDWLTGDDRLAISPRSLPLPAQQPITRQPAMPAEPQEPAAIPPQAAVPDDTTSPAQDSEPMAAPETEADSAPPTEEIIAPAPAQAPDSAEPPAEPSIAPDEPESETPAESAPEPETPAVTETPPALTTPEPVTPPPPAPVNPPPSNSGFAQRLGVQDAAWLQQQKRGNFTLQLLSASRESTIESFVKTNKLGRDAAYYLSTRKEQPWHVLVYGIYPNAAQASAAAKRLPKQLVVAEPWIRPLSDIQKEILEQP